MNMVDIILKKKAGEALSAEEIRFFAQGAAAGTIPDYQLSALLMAICWRGMNAQETTCLTMEMMHSGGVVDLSAIDGVCVDKHSTGGVGDTTTLVLVPLAAACGAKVAKISGRGLGHTGGTLDKLESIPGCSVEETEARFVRQVQEIGCAVIGQTHDLCPADKALYALRDVTGTVDCIPLIASSIVSKKLASGAGAIVLDVKTGSGALMHTLEDSIALAKAMVDIGAQAGKPILALVTGMEQPLGTHVGNALEVKEAIDILAGRAGGDLLVEISIRRHPIFTRNGTDVLCEVPITFTQAALGATIQVPTLDGKVDYEIPEGTQTGREFILREKGIPEVGNTRRRGNERFTVVVETPTRLTKEQKDLLRQLDGSVDQSPKRKKFLNNLKDFFG